MVFYGRQNKGISYGRASDSTDTWGCFRTPTPGRRNHARCLKDHHVLSARAESGNGKCRVTATVLGAPEGCRVNAIISAAGEYSCVELKRERSSKETYSGEVLLPPGVTGSFYVVARSAEGVARTYPMTAPSRKLLLLPGSVPASPLQISELMASNSRTVRSDAGGYCDWVELHNPTARPVSLEGFCLTDDPSLSKLWKLPPGMRIEPGGHVLIWADGNPDNGRMHAGFRLTSRGESLFLVRRTENGLRVIDRVEYPALAEDESYARGQGGSWKKSRKPTPGGKNRER
jgi:hypothetical protein